MLEFDPTANVRALVTIAHQLSKNKHQSASYIRMPRNHTLFRLKLPHHAYHRPHVPEREEKTPKSTSLPGDDTDENKWKKWSKILCCCCNQVRAHDSRQQREDATKRRGKMHKIICSFDRQPPPRMHTTVQCVVPS